MATNGWCTAPRCSRSAQQVCIHVDPFDIQIMNKPESEDEEAVNIEE